jgi:diazepam-binding inhibitor (GABA receptor modulator, acyl-CoA-binding protein)
MADLKAQFEAAAGASKTLAERPDNETLLQLYALFKQGKEGDASGSRPGFADLIGRAKYDAWAKLKGTKQETAMQQSVDLVNELKG